MSSKPQIVLVKCFPRVIILISINVVLKLENIISITYFNLQICLIVIIHISNCTACPVLHHTLLDTHVTIFMLKNNENCLLVVTTYLASLLCALFVYWH